MELKKNQYNIINKTLKNNKNIRIYVDETRDWLEVIGKNSAFVE